MTKADTMRLLRPAANVLGFYDGRIDGLRLHGPQPNWLDDAERYDQMGLDFRDGNG